jgi:hypothetical protein
MYLVGGYAKNPIIWGRYRDQVADAVMEAKPIPRDAGVQYPVASPPD